MNLDKLPWRVILLVLLLPLFIINVKNSHDWGDDFAQYLIQAKNISEGIPQTENGLIVNKSDPMYAIQAYPIGLPLLLSPIYALSGLELKPYFLLMSLLLVMAGFFCFEYFRKQSNDLLALIITLLLCYNPVVLVLKKQILSEIPFTCLLMFILYWPYMKQYKSKYSWIISGILFALLISIRLAGIAALFAFIIYQLNNMMRNKSERRSTGINLALTIIVTFCIFYLLNVTLFSIEPIGLMSFYAHSFQSNDIRIGYNFDYYYSVLRNILPFYGTWIPAWWLLFTFAGWFIRFLKFRTLGEYFFPLYLLLVIMYPYSNGGYRLIIPVLPLLFFYLYYFFNWLFYWIGKRPQKVSLVILIVLLISYSGTTWSILKSQSIVEDGPQKNESKEMLSFVKSTSTDIPVVFCRARAMSLYSGHPTLYFSREQNDDEAFNRFKDYKKLILVVSKKKDSQVFDIRLRNFLFERKDFYNRVWENEEFEIFENK